MQAFRAQAPRRTTGTASLQQRRYAAPRLACHASAAVANAASVDAAIAWATSKGAKLEKASLSTDLSTDKPVLIASADAQQGDVLVSVPDSAWLSAENVQKTSVGKLAAAAGLEPWLQIALQLVADRFGGAKSEFATLASSLPEDLGTPLLWNEEELRELQGSQVLQTLAGYM